MEPPPSPSRERLDHPFGIQPRAEDVAARLKRDAVLEGVECDRVVPDPIHDLRDGPHRFWGVARHAPDLRGLRVRIQRGITRIFGRAHSAGVIRPDVTAEDLYFVTLSNAAVTGATRDVAPDAWKRNVALHLDAFRPAAASPLPAPPLTVRQLARSVAASGA